MIRDVRHDCEMGWNTVMVYFVGFAGTSLEEFR
jgi:hypothetical protein